MTSEVVEKTQAHPDGHVRDAGQVAVDMAGAGKELGLPTSTIRNHAYVIRGMGYVPESRLSTGLFGRMFRRLDAYIPDEARIEAVAGLMSEPSGAALDGKIPAGYTYLGQFIDHDITFDPASSLQRQNDPDALTNFRTPRFDLDSVYGRGPADQPYLYRKPTSEAPPHFDIGRVTGSDDEMDLPRARGIALIGDPRNDENVIISQLQLTFMLFHNKVCDWLTENGGQNYLRHRRGNEEVFDCAQRLVRWHYQWIVIHDFLRQIVDPDTYEDVLYREPLTRGGDAVERVRLRFFSWDGQIFMPIEFAVAAYRFGHSLVRGRYRLNENVAKPIFTQESVIGPGDEEKHLGGFRPLPRGWQIEWGRFFNLNGPEHLQLVRRIDRFLATPLLCLPPELAGGVRVNLAQRNLARGARLGLPAGQEVALAMGIEPLGDAELDLPGNGPSPLWYYVLREAELRNGGLTLGPVGSRIVAEVFCGMLLADPSSYLSNAPGWRPVLPGDNWGDFTMAHLITFTGFGLRAS
ncbi:peroxidase family protein [Streptomyces radicis]|uniref:Peroxidase n=1 Tax=Streptomyces radicis TaxID=1750517 RepID=A0A3A9VTU0_9ACTN|nr:heme peroxidase family protein [Streptomyces radicis]RKN04501.1 peroxidase [Streptomyces radicis]RKN15479.1 peroxidase [Streptomyces radicis]